MPRPTAVAGTTGTLILLQDSAMEPVNPGHITGPWNVVPATSSADCVATVARMFRAGGNVVIAALDTESSHCVIDMQQNDLQAVSGMLLVGESLDALDLAVAQAYHGDLVFLTKEVPAAGLLHRLRRRFSGLRTASVHETGCIRRQLVALLTRIEAGAHARRIPLVSWR